MKNTKCLFDESQSTKGMVSVSQIQTFMSCAKKWSYGYIDNLTPRVERSYLTIGKLCHKGMQTAMHYMWVNSGAWNVALNAGLEAIKDEHRTYINSIPLLDEEIPELYTMLDDALSVFQQAFTEFEPWKYEVVSVYKDGEAYPALELHFRIPCPPTNGLHGFIDAILKDKDTGFIWCTDYKFRKSLSPDEDEAFNLQNAVYSRACERMGIKVTGTMTWQHVNTPAADPQVLKNGAVSRAKIKTTWSHYENFLMEHNQDPEDYKNEMIPKLADIEWFRATYEYRNRETVERIWKKCVVPAASRIRKAYNPKAINYPSVYPWNCKMCQYQDLCQAELRGYDADFIKLREYVVRDDKKVVDTHPAAVV